jgi:hypothetical protein
MIFKITKILMSINQIDFQSNAIFDGEHDHLKIFGSKNKHF